MLPPLCVGEQCNVYAPGMSNVEPMCYTSDGSENIPTVYMRVL